MYMCILKFQGFMIYDLYIQYPQTWIFLKNVISNFIFDLFFIFP